MFSDIIINLHDYMQLLPIVFFYCCWSKLLFEYMFDNLRLKQVQFVIWLLK